MMQEFLSWGALIGASGSIVAIITFWFSRGKAEAEAITRSDAAYAMAKIAIERSESTSVTLANARIEFVRDFATHRDLSEAEARYAAALEGLRTELRGMNDRLDRILENFIGRQTT